MKKVLLAALFVGVLAVTGALASPGAGDGENSCAGIEHACGGCNATPGEGDPSIDGCLNAGDAVCIGGSVTEDGGVVGCLIVGDACVSGTGDPTTTSTNCDDCFAAADQGCTADHLE